MGRNKNNDRKQEFLSGISERTRIPGEIVTGSCCITTTGSNELIIENYKSILEYQADRLIVMTRHGKVEVCGKRLEISYYSREEMKVTGKIECISYK